MFKKIARLLLPNPFDRMLKQAPKKILLAWNRGLGDIALGLYAMVHRIRQKIPHAEITFLIRENLQDGFSLLPHVQTIVAPSWKRGEPYDVPRALQELKIDPKSFDLVIDRPNPTDWVRWQLGTLVPKLEWKEEYDALAESFFLPSEFQYIGIQIAAETTYGLWRNWPEERWRELKALLPANYKFLLFGFSPLPVWEDEQVFDLRGKTSLFEMMAIIKNLCAALIVPDSGILSMMYYLDRPFPLHIISLWADPQHGILKQNVRSPNPLLNHSPLIAPQRDLSLLSARQVYECLFPAAKPFSPLPHVLRWEGAIPKRSSSGIGCIILAGGQGTRLGFSGPKGLFSLRGKTLFERLLEKIPDSVPIAIMTSPANHEETLQYVTQPQFSPKKISCFPQSTLPLLNEKKQPIGLEGADGNGSLYRSFVQAGLLDDWRRLGVSTLTITPIDNVLADPLDPILLAVHTRSFAEITIRCIERSDPDEPLGLLALRDDKPHIIEYCDFPPPLFRQIDLYPYAYTGLLALELSFLRKAASLDLPLHWVQKNIPYHGTLWKGEKFIFDAFPSASSIAVLCSARETCYAPLKTKDGPQGIEATEACLS